MRSLRYAGSCPCAFRFCAVELKLSASALWKTTDSSRYCSWCAALACASVQKPRSQSGQSIVAAILGKIDTIINHKARTPDKHHMDPRPYGYRWKRTESEAKHAATTPKAGPPFRYTPMKACRVQYIRTITKEQWNKLWLESTTTARQLRSSLKHLRSGNPIPSNASPKWNVQMSTIQLLKRVGCVP
jgi:hypothetical protein